MDQPSWIGRTLSGRYRIESLLGQGGMSAVYKASDPNLKRVVAVKLIHSHLSTDPSFVQRFESEAAAAASLRHPNIVQVYDFNNDSGVYYMVMEFIPGETLHDRLKRLAENNRKLSMAEALKFTLNISDSMAYAHRRGMVHRDIKPANIMLDVQGQAILMDFGIVKIIGGDSHTSTGAVVGTASYMPPETIRGETADHRSDIYSLGVTLFEMLSGRPPFVADSAMTLMMMHVNNPVPDVRNFRPDVHPEVAATLERCLAKNREERYQSAGELSAHLKRVIETIEAQPTALVKPGPPMQQNAQAVGSSGGGAPVKPESGEKLGGGGQGLNAPQDSRLKTKTNIVRYVIAGGALALLLFMVSGMLLLRNISARIAPDAENTPALPAFTATFEEAAAPPGFETFTATIPVVTELPAVTLAPTAGRVLEVQHSLFPAASFTEGRPIFDVESKDTGAEKRAPYGDSYAFNIFERPFLQDMTYIPDLDISSFNIRRSDDWYYLSFDIIGTDPNNPLGILYGVELDQDLDGFGDFMIIAEPPFAEEWSTSGVTVYADANHDSAGDSPNKSDAPFTSDGFETLLYDGAQPNNPDPDLAWARYYGEHSIQFAFKSSWAGEAFMYTVITDAGLKDVTKMDYNDRFSMDEAGSPVRSSEHYPLLSLYAVDNTCRGAVGFNPRGYEPRLCSVLAPPTLTPKPTLITITPTADSLTCQPPPEGCPADAPNWWPAPHCACSTTPYTP